MTMFKMTPKQVRAGTIECMEAGLVPFISSSPGLGKSAIMRQIADDFGLILIDLRLTQCAPEDLMGLPMRNGDKATFAPFEMFPIEGDKLPEGKNGWLLFCDELPSAMRATQAAAYKLMLDKMVGQYELHGDVYVVAAGNLMTDKAIVNPMGTAMQSRLVHMEMAVSMTDFVDYAIKAKMDHRILGFLDFQPGKLHQFDPDHNDRTFACPRTWEFASKLIKGKTTDEINLPLLAGTISDGVAVEFHTFIKEYDRLPSFASILNQPETLGIPSEASTRYALTNMLLEKFTEDNFPDVIKYVARFPAEFRTIFLRGVNVRNPKMSRTKAYRKHSADFVDFLHEDEPNNYAA